jgi:ATP-binding cassette, subfamily B, heavy metal transporter
MFMMLETIPSVQDAPSALPLRIDNGSIHFMNVSFGYKPEERYILNDISFDISGGSTFGIVGPTGSGKVCFHFGSLLKMMLRNDESKFVCNQT